MESKIKKRLKRHKKIRARVFGTKEMPRLCVFRSNQHMYAVIINDEDQKTIATASDKSIKSLKGKKKVEIAREVGKLIAKKAQDSKIEKVVFDRAGFLFHGRVKAVAEGAREAGLKF